MVELVEIFILPANGYGRACLEKIAAAFGRLKEFYRYHDI